MKRGTRNAECGTGKSRVELCAPERRLAAGLDRRNFIKRSATGSGGEPVKKEGRSRRTEVRGQTPEAQRPRSGIRPPSSGIRILVLFLSAFFILHSAFAQAVLTADGLATFIPPPAAGGGGGGLPCTPSYANTGGTGDRRSIITITASGANVPTSGNWINGDNSSNGQFFFGDAALTGSQWLQFDFGSGNTVLITEAKYYQQNTTAEGTWKWQGSNDASSWTDLGGTFALGGVATETITSLSGNTTKYRYYRMLGLSGSTSSNPWVYEMEFKICGLP